MKLLSFRKLAAAALFAAVCCASVSCDKDNGGDNPATEIETTDVIGTYAGTMTVTGTDAAPAEVETEVTATGIEFNNFPVEGLVNSILPDGAESLLPMLGQISYTLPYSAEVNSGKTGLSLTFSPEPLELSIMGGVMKVTVEVEAGQAGTYTAESKELVFSMTATQAIVSMTGSDPSTMPLDVTLQFNLTKK